MPMERPVCVSQPIMFFKCCISWLPPRYVTLAQVDILHLLYTMDTTYYP